MTQRDKSTLEPAEPSSSMVALRTIVMIAFLVAIPLMAVFGTGLPTSLRTAMQGGAEDSGDSAPDRRQSEPPASNRSSGELETSASAPSNGMATSSNPEAGASGSLTEPWGAAQGPRATITGVRTPDASPRARITQVRTLPQAQEDSPAPANTAPLWAPGPRTAASSRVRNTTARFAESKVRRREPLAPAASSSEPKRTAAAESWQATAYSQRAKAAAPSPPDEDSIADADDPFASGERRLRQYGATHYRLESWGDDGQLFRCSANVALPNHRYGARHFEATAASPSQAIDRLLQKVEDWRAAEH